MDNRSLKSQAEESMKQFYTFLFLTTLSIHCFFLFVTELVGIPPLLSDSGVDIQKLAAEECCHPLLNFHLKSPKP